MSNTTICGGEHVSLVQLSELLAEGLTDYIDETTITLAVDLSRATTLARLTNTPGQVHAVLYFSGWSPTVRTRSGIRVASWVMELNTYQGVTDAEDTTNASVQTATELLDAAEKLATGMESLQFEGYDIATPELVSSSWILSEDGQTINGLTINFSVTYCPPVLPMVKVTSLNLPSGTGFIQIS